MIDEEGVRGGRGSVPLATVSTVQAAAGALRELILDGTLEPGARLRENDFAERLGIARHSFRAATQILIGEGLLRREPNRGVHVPVFGREDIEDIFKLRVALELEAVRLVTEAGEVPEDARESVTELSALSNRAPWHEVVGPDLRFHRAIITASGSERIARAYLGLQSEITLCLVQLRPHYDRPAEVAAEHEELLAAIADAKSNRAQVLFRKHLDDAAANLIRALSEQESEEPKAASQALA
jgi:DNA-binding GntR family transcriptional regulator